VLEAASFGGPTPFTERMSRRLDSASRIGSDGGELRDYCRTKLSKSEVPERIYIVSDFPRTAKAPLIACVPHYSALAVVRRHNEAPFTRYVGGISIFLALIAGYLDVMTSCLERMSRHERNTTFTGLKSDRAIFTPPYLRNSLLSFVTGSSWKPLYSI